MKTTCIMCPVGCSLEIKKINNEIKVSGNNCLKGDIYGKSEFTNPVRVVTYLARTNNSVVSCKTTTAVSKKIYFDVIEEIKKLKLENVKHGDVIIKNVLSSGADVVITGNI